ncbi:putative ribosome-binding factor A, mitochondrial isoform X2 [Phyllostomus hastatus]|uniref:putative ribosome-binding factor A, mitochondrial isoform X2 n=1 Tax=Phyllostomus hastatus TaxID=9423 RepID=UPI001E683FFF|nr:putative ribosome-binding factor A, mitochondrial isoform X2 [Phyllostomus hastatus]
MWATAPRLLGVSPGLRALLGGRQAGRLPGGARGLHGSPVPCGKNLLKKFASKTKKKFWYEGPSLGSHLTYKPSQLEFLTKSTSKKTRKEDHVRLRALNGLLYKALSDLLCTPEVSQQVYDLNVELSKVERLLAAADLGPADEDLGRGDLRDLEAPEAPSPYDTPGPAVPSSLCGIDHEALHKQIAEYKRRKEKGREGESESPACPGLETAAELRRAVKRRKKARPRRVEELSPKNYPWELAGGDDLEDGRTLPEELALGCEWECGQAEPDTKAERGGGRRTEAAVADHGGRGL